MAVPAPEADDELADDGAGAESRSFALPAAQHGARLDRALADLVPEFSRNYLSQLVADGAVRLNGATATKPAHKVRAGDQLVIELRPTPMSQAFVPQAMDLNVLYEDEHLAVIDKPAGLVVHPAPGNWSGTLLNGLLARDAKAALLPRAGIVHRLDKDTSGLMVVARDRSTMDRLVGQIAAREVKREYWAFGQGHWKRGSEQVCSVDAAIGRDPRNRLRMAVVDLDRGAGKPAQTLFQLLQTTEQGCLVRCLLRTGRTHQIRVHFAALGHPLLGDALYGGDASLLARPALHSAAADLTQPVTGQPLHITAPVPEDLRAFGFERYL